MSLLARRRSWRRGALLALLPWWGPPGDAHRAVEEGNALYRAGQYEAALGEYAAAAAVLPDAPEIALNQGNAWFRRFDFEQALEHYLQALDTRDPHLASRAQYNLGVVKYQQALEAMESFGEPVAATRAAIEHFRDSLRLDPDLADARYNLELAYRLLRRIEEQRAQGQGAETRDQQAAESRGQSSEGTTEQQAGADSAAAAEEETAGRVATGALPRGAASPTGDRARTAGLPKPISREAAEGMLEMLRQRSAAAESLREAQQRARLREARSSKIW